MAEPEAEVIPLAEEFVEIDKRVDLTGRVLVRTSTEEFEELASVSLDSEEVEVTRVPINREVTEIPKTRSEGNVTIIPVVAETFVIEKRLVLVEEVHLRRVIKTTETEVPVTLRKQHASIERQTYPTPSIEEK